MLQSRLKFSISLEMFGVCPLVLQKLVLCIPFCKGGREAGREADPRNSARRAMKANASSGAQSEVPG